MSRKFILAAVAAISLSLSGAAMAAGHNEMVPAHIAKAVADASRPEADTKRDADRKPGPILAFAGVKAGDKVAELLPGGGYFTRLLSSAVGPTGAVYAAMPAADLAKAMAKGNVTPVLLSPATFATPQPVDVMFTAQNYHDFHLKRLNLDVAAVNKALMGAIKPGGVLLVIDHAAAAGAPLEVADTLHRIDPAKVRAELEAAGFKYEGELNALRNPADDKTKGVFDASVRGKTDQFVYKFRKPA
ncbi:class I SAM-dependent methyltransferase [Phenylobacterium sp.]|uniref:class I SAM-dependent methyltransferase n=1 Tax=Phenylobacterium sp. TaxID=1871053 RepID=UPI003983A554